VPQCRTNLVRRAFPLILVRFPGVAEPAAKNGRRFSNGLKTTGGEDFALGVNNLFNVKAPGCISCDLNNFDPTAYDLPGRYYYVRASFKM